MSGVSISRHAVALSDAQLDALADRIAERLRVTDDASCPSEAPRLVDARAVAHAIGISRDAVYAHAEQLGGHRVGDGPRGRLRFDLDRALAAWTSRSSSKESHQPKTPTTTGSSPRRRRQGMGSSPDLLPIRGSTVPLNAVRERS